MTTEEILVWILIALFAILIMMAELYDGRH